MTDLIAERVRELFDYDRVTGVLRRRISIRSGRAKAGDIVGTLNQNGALYVSIDGKDYSVHRVIWLWVHGEWPRELIDHANRDRVDNRWCNIRPANHSQNGANSRARSEFNHKGLDRMPNGRIRARIKHNGRTKYLGTFQDVEIAKRAYARAARYIFGEFARVE